MVPVSTLGCGSRQGGKSFILPNRSSPDGIYLSMSSLKHSSQSPGRHKESTQSGVKSNPVAPPIKAGRFESTGQKFCYSPRVLIIDESPTIRSSLKKNLSQMGAMVTEASDGSEGLKIVESLDFDLIITDIELRAMDEFDFCSKLKSLLTKRSIPVVILSAKEKEKDVQRAFKVGAVTYIPKSNTINHIRARIKEILDKHSFLSGRIVLVADDSASIRNMIDKAFREAGFQVICAENGNHALELLKRFTPDIILSDLHMPQLDGLSLCKAVRADKDLCRLPFIIMSSDSDRAKMRQLLEYGASAYLVKPFNIDELVVTVERFLANHFKLILDERKLLESERQLSIGSVSSLVLAVEARDQYTCGHSESVSALAVDIARDMCLDEEQIERVKIAGKLHDIGKIGIRDNILLKPGPLDDEEWKILKLHPLIGEKILRPLQSLSDIVPAVLSHHERIDGKGYPHGLKGSRIPPWARILAVADTYDALTSDRPYRKGFSRDDALSILEDVTGTQLCPECVQSFFASLAKKAIIDVAAEK